MARNEGVRASRSQLIAFLDQDDVWHRDKLARQLARVEAEPQAAFWSTGFNWVSVDSVRPAPSSEVPTYHSLLSDGHVCLSSVLARKDEYWRVGGHNPLLRQMQDWHLFLRLLMWGQGAAVCKEPLVDYHLHGTNVSSDYWAAASERFELLRQHDRRAKRVGDEATSEAVARGIARTRELYGQQALDAGRNALARRDAGGMLLHLGHTARLSPKVLAAAAAQRVGL